MSFGRNWREPPRSPQALSKRSMAISLLRAWTLRSCKRRASSPSSRLERIAALNDSKGIATLMGDLAAAGESRAAIQVGCRAGPQGFEEADLEPLPGRLPLLAGDLWGGNSENILDRYEAHIVRVFMLPAIR
jgi:hypothetical protein